MATWNCCLPSTTIITPNLRADGDGRLEQFLDLFRPRVRGDVVILRFASEQKIAHAAADPERGEAGRLQAADNVLRQFAR